MSEKKCNKCGEVKAFSEYSKKLEGLQPSCKSCVKITNRQHYLKNREKIIEQNTKYYEENKDYINSKKSEYSKVYEKVNRVKINARKRRHYQTNKEAHKKRGKKWIEANYEAHRAYRRNYAKEKRANSIQYRLVDVLRCRLRSAIGGEAKASSTMELLGCTAEYAVQHLENQFTEGMTWGNHSYRGWHIDHIIPCASYDMSDPEQQKECFRYTNLQPLWAEDNLKKSDKLPTEHQVKLL